MTPISGAHLSEEQLILHYYRETDVQDHLGACPKCAAEYEKLSRVLDVCNRYEVPERPPGYETLLWQRIAPEIAGRDVQPQTAWWAWLKSPWIASPALAALLVAVFLAGRFSTPRPSSQEVLTAANPISSQGRERILLVALGNHLERSQMVLVELANAKPEGNLNIQGAQRRAQELVSENRLYRQTAMQDGDNEFNGLLDELERVLTDIANGPSDLSSPQLERLQKRIENRGLIFKVRVLGTNLQQEGTKQL